MVLDLETVGLDPTKHGIHTIAFTDVHGDLKRIRLNPFSYGKAIYSPKAVEMSGMTVGQLKMLPSAKDAVRVFLREAGKFPGEKVTLIGFNISSFDKPMLQELIDSVYPGTYYKYFTHKPVDVFELTKWFQHLGIIDTGSSQSLEAVAKYFGYAHKPHDAISDVDVTAKLYKKYKEMLDAVHRAK